MTFGNTLEITPDDDLALRAVPEHTTAAWAVGDADAFAAAFTDDAKVVIAGTYLTRHDQILAYVRAAFAGPFKGTQVVSAPVMISYLDRDTALIMTEGGVLAPGETTVAEARALRGTWILSRSGTDWRISAYHSSPMTIVS